MRLVPGDTSISLDTTISDFTGMLAMVDWCFQFAGASSPVFAHRPSRAAAA